MVEFNRTNPATSNFQRWLQHDMRQRQGEQNLEAQRMAMDFDREANPSRLRSIVADTGHRESNLRVAQGTEADRIAISNEQARRAPLDTERAQFDLDHARDLAPFQLRSAAAGARSGEAGAVAQEMKGFYESLDLIQSGNLAAAKQVASAYGHDLPDEIISNTAFMGAVSRIAQEALQRYPNSPKTQKTYIESAMEGLRDGNLGQSRMVSPSYQFEVPNAPEPPALSGTNQRPPSDVQTAEWLIQQGVASDAAEAWNLVRASRTNPDQVRANIYNRWVASLSRGKLGDIDGPSVATEAERLTDRTMQFLQSQQGAQSGQLGLQSTSPATQPAQVQTQEEFDALPSGALFVNPADGQVMIKR